MQPNPPGYAPPPPCPCTSLKFGFAPFARELESDDRQQDGSGILWEKPPAGVSTLELEQIYSDEPGQCTFWSLLLRIAEKYRGPTRGEHSAVEERTSLYEAPEEENDKFIKSCHISISPSKDLLVYYFVIDHSVSFHLKAVHWFALLANQPDRC
jgi:hypothetical protein